MDIQGKTALVTGGASGLGRATLTELSKAGANGVIVDLERSNGAEVAKELGDNVVFAPADVTNEAQVQAAIALAVERFGALHIAVNCAGIGWAQRTSAKSGPHDLRMFEMVVRVNLIGTFNVIRLAATQMSAQDPVDTVSEADGSIEREERGVIINTASVAAYDGQIGQVAYSASKAGVVGLTLPVARDLANRQIRCCTIAPGTFDTPMLAGLPEPQRRALAENTPHPHRLGRPEEYARLARAIIETPMLNGETIRLDGALRMPPR